MKRVEEKKSSPVVAAVSLIVSAAVIGGAWGGGIPLLADKQQEVIEQQVVLDAMKQLNTAITAKRDPVQLCVYAQMVSAAMIQAKDSAKLAEFTPIEKKFCQAAGIQ